MQTTGDPPDRFPRTRHSLLRSYGGAGEETRRVVLDALLSAYWKPVYKLLRVRWRLSSEDAQDLTQGFFAALIGRRFLERYDPARGRFRTYLRVCLDGFVSNELKAARAEKRGGGAPVLSLDVEGADREILAEKPAEPEIEDYFRREWIRQLFATAVESVRARCEASGRSRHFALFERCDLDPPVERPSYEDLAREFGLTRSQVTNHLHSVRAMFRAAVLERLREITGSDEEFREEAREALGIDAP